MFPEKNKSFTDRYHDLSLTILTVTRNKLIKPPMRKCTWTPQSTLQMTSITVEWWKSRERAFWFGVWRAKPISEALCSFLFNLFLILSFLLLAFYYITELDFGVKPVKKTLVGSSFDRFVSQRRFQVPRRRKTKTNGGLDHRRKSSSNCLSVLEQCFTS